MSNSKVSAQPWWTLSALIVVSQFGSMAIGQDDEAPRFRPRTDDNAVRDTEQLRIHLNNIRDSQGPMSPLGEFLKRNAVKSNISIEPERDADAPPPMDRKSFEGRAQSDTSRTRAKSNQGIVALPGPRYTIVQGATNAPSNTFDGFRPVRMVSDQEANTKPRLDTPVQFASATIPLTTIPSNVISNYQFVDIPGGNGSAGIPNNPVIPPANILPNVPYGVNPGVGAANPLDAAVFPPTIPYSPPATGLAPNTNFVPPPTNYAAPNAALINTPAPYYPQPNYPQPNQPGFNPQPVQPMSPTYGSVPSYGRNQTTVNDLPFVSGAPCQFDASYMVSRSVYRQPADSCNNPCGPTGNPNAYAPYAPYAGSGSPLAYVPPTYMPNRYRNPPFPILLGFGQNLNNAYLSRGIIGQPTAYVDGQPVRNFIRYLSP